MINLWISFSRINQKGADGISSLSVHQFERHITAIIKEENFYCIWAKLVLSESPKSDIFQLIFVSQKSNLFYNYSKSKLASIRLKHFKLNWSNSIISYLSKIPNLREGGAKLFYLKVIFLLNCSHIKSRTAATEMWEQIGAQI